MNIASVINKLANYKVDVYSDDATRADITDFIKNYCGVNSIFQGQKRIVVRDDSNVGSPVVYKIAYSTQGIEDNIYEVSFGARLSSLLQNNKITPDQFNRFGIAKLVSDDPFIIKMRAVTPINKDADFLSWYDREGKHQYPNFEKNKTIIIWLSKNKTLISDYNTIQSIISTYGIGSDSTMNEPLNFGTVYENGVKRLVIIDLGSVIPILSNKDREAIRPVCPSCGRPMRYIALNITGPVSPDDVDSFDGRYGCNTPSCPNFHETVAKSQLLNIDQRDSVVFSEYVTRYRNYIRILKAVYGRFYLPLDRVIGFTAYQNALASELGRRHSLEEIQAFYNNYQYKMVGELVKRCPEVKQMPVVKKNNGTIVSVRPYSNFRDSLMRHLNSVGESVDSIAFRTASIVYLIKVCQEYGKLESFNVLSKSSENDFMNSMVKLIGRDEAKKLYIDLTV